MKQLMSAPQLKFRAKRQDPAETSGPEQEPKESALMWTGGSAAATKAISALLIACLFAGPLALLGSGWFVLSATAPVPAPVITSEAAQVDERAAVESFAEDFVTTWLTTPDGEARRLEPFLANYSGVTLPEQPWTAWSPTTAGIERSEDGQWAVTVAATVAAGKEPGVRRFFQVPVVYVDGALVAQALPTPVAGPAVADPGRLNYRFRATPSDSISVAAGEFLNALLVGTGDVTRFISPGATIRAVTPAPYTAVELEDVLVDQELRDGDAQPETGRTLHLLVSATGSLDADRAISVQYALTMTAREGRWEVAAIDSTPLSLSEQTTTQPEASPSVSSGTPSEPTSPNNSTTN